LPKTVNLLLAEFSECLRQPCSNFLAHDGFTDGCQRDGCQFQVLKSEGDTDDGHKAAQCRDHMANCKPDAGKDEPNDVSNGSQRAGADVIGTPQFCTADRFSTKRQESEPADNEACPGSGQTDDGDGTNEAGEPPPQSHDKATED
jgi:hypothetical protein